MSQVTARRRLAGGVVGTFVEWYDFLVYGLSAPILAARFFPSASPAAALLGTFAIYAVAFLVRPLGGLYFGSRSDRSGRIGVLSRTVLLIGVCTTAIGLLPTYQTIGIAAAVLLLVCRVGQGFSAGGETSSGLSYVVESAPAGRRARWVSYAVAASFLPVVVASLLIVALRLGLGTAAYQDWAWRIPFLLGGVLALIGLWLRRRLDDPAEFTEAVGTAPSASPVRAVTRDAGWQILRVALLVAVQAVGAYLLLSYMYSYLVSPAVGLDPTAALLANAAAIAAMAVLVCGFGVAADRIGRKPLMLAGAAWLLVGAWPALVLTGSGTVTGALAGQGILAVGVSLFCAGGFVTMLELFSTTTRSTGHAIGYNVGYAVFGGTTALVAAALVQVTGSGAAPSWYLIAVSAVGLVVVLATPETFGRRLRDSASREAVDQPALSRRRTRSRCGTTV